MLRQDLGHNGNGLRIVCSRLFVTGEVFLLGRQAWDGRGGADAEFEDFDVEGRRRVIVWSGHCAIDG